jgi:hypothetical protein
MQQVGEAECGRCITIVSGREVFLGEGVGHRFNGKPWSQIRASAVILPAEESYAPLAAYIINSCHKLKCNAEVDRFLVKLNSLNGLAGAIKNPP